MRKWDDKPPASIQELNKASYIFLGLVNAFTIITILYTNQISSMQIFGLVSSVVLVYLFATGKFYKLLRWYVEYRLKKRDNKWR